MNLKFLNKNLFVILLSIVVILSILHLFYLFLKIPKVPCSKNGNKCKRETFENNLPKIAIVSANFGDYDKPKSHTNVLKSDLVDWYCFTENPNIDLQRPMWNIITESYHLSDQVNTKNAKNSIPNNDQIINNMMSAKYYKIQTHKVPILRKYDYYIWIDGSLFLRDDFLKNIFPLIDNGESLISFAHTLRKTIKDETNVSLDIGKYRSQEILAQYNNYMNEGFPDNIGLYENTIMIKKNDAKMAKLFDDWWNENLQKTYQDQISWPYVLWKNNILPDHVVYENVFNNNFFSYIDYENTQKH